MELTKNQKADIITQKILSYNSQIFSAKLDMSCAEALEDEQWKDKIRESTKRLMQLVEVLEKELDAISD